MVEEPLGLFEKREVWPLCVSCDVSCDLTAATNRLDGSLKI